MGGFDNGTFFEKACIIINFIVYIKPIHYETLRH